MAFDLATAAPVKDGGGFDLASAKPVGAPDVPPKADRPSTLGRYAAAGPLGIGAALATPEGRQDAGNALAGLLRGAGSIGATLMAPIDMGGDAADAALGKAPGTQTSNQQRRSDMTQTLADMGAQPDSMAFAAGKLGGEVAGTAGAGGVLGNALGRTGIAAPGLVNALRTGGMVAGPAVPGALGGAANLLTRAAGGAVSGGASAGLVDPNLAGPGAAIGAILPPVLKGAGAAGSLLAEAGQDAARRLMQSALKPTIKQLKTGEAATAVQTLLDYGINPTEKGVEKLRALIDTKNTEIANEVASSGATVDKQNVLNALGGVRAKFGNQVSPSADLASIQGVADDFAAHPNLLGSAIPVQTAQAMKQGTYRVLAGKYGQMGSAETEAQKALARGLKDEIATAVPAVGPLNAEESRLLSTLSVAERRALMDMNKNPMGLAALAHNPVGWLAFMADKSAAFKALAARALNTVASVSPNPAAQQNLLRATASPLLRSSVGAGSGQNANP